MKKPSWIPDYSEATWARVGFGVFLLGWAVMLVVLAVVTFPHAVIR